MPKNKLSLKKLPIFALLSVVTLLVMGAVSPNKTWGQEEETAEEAEMAEEQQEEVEDLQEKIREYENKIEDLGEQKNSLQKEIEYANSQIELTRLKIQNTINQITLKEKKIRELGEEINNLANRIERIADSIAYQKEVLEQRQRSYYKVEQSTTEGFDFLLFLLNPVELERKVQKTTYSEIMQERDKKLLEEMNRTKTAFANQKGIFEDKKEEEETLKAETEQERASLEGYKKQLDDQKAQKKQLLADTQNSEAKYQELLEEAREKLESYKAFVQNAGGGVIGPNGLGGGEKGWYYSQRDSRWAGNAIGNSSYTIFESGCLVTSVAMIHRYYGYNTDPADIAGRDSYFIFGNMRIPWPGPGGRRYSLLGWGYPKSAIDSELEDENPVIVGVHANNAAGTHFIVLAEKDNGSYVMYDPYYGPDLKFSDYYSTSAIFEAVAFK